MGIEREASAVRGGVHCTLTSPLFATKIVGNDFVGNLRDVNGRLVARFGAAFSFRELMDSLLDLVDDHAEYFKSLLVQAGGDFGLQAVEFRFVICWNKPA